MAEKKNGAQILWDSLVREGVDVVFGLPGGATLPSTTHWPSTTTQSVTCW